jgi:long-subunit fatty acid transport protein
VSLSSLDFNKVILSFGGSLYVGPHWRFDAVFAHVFAESVSVDPNTAKIATINPLPGNAPPEYVNGGQYRVTSNVVGVGLNYRF